MTDHDYWSPLLVSQSQEQIAIFADKSPKVGLRPRLVGLHGTSVLQQNIRTELTSWGQARKLGPVAHAAQVHQLATSDS